MGFAQISLEIFSDTNKLCDGNGCNYTGPTILINEVMIKPENGDGSMAGVGPGFSPTQCRGEWIELYNANKCDSIDISCYFLGNNTWDDEQHFGGGFELPPGTIVPPMGFVLIRGEMAPEVHDTLLIQNGGNCIEITVSENQHICVGGGFRLWFPNVGGWFAFYNSNGHPEDAIYWNDLSFSDLNAPPCTPNADCPYTGWLSPFSGIPNDKKNYIFNYDPVIGRSYRRIPDGGSWMYQQPGLPTMGYCNSTCVQPGLSTCTGKLFVTAQGGTPPYTYAWNDPAQQTGVTASGLCAGYYCVTVTDAAGITAVICDSVVNFIPKVSLDSLPDLCSNSLPVMLTGGHPAGGNYSGPGVFEGKFYPDSAGVDTVLITYTYVDEDSCINAAYRSFRLFGAPVAHLDPLPDLCDNSQPVDFGSQVPPGGVLSGTGLVGTVFYPPLAGAGLFEIILVLSDQEGCVDKDTVEIVINSAPTASVLPPDTFCVSQEPVLFDFGSPPGGIYYLNQQPVTTLYPSQFGTGTFAGRYIYESALNGCPDTAFFPIIIRPAPQISLQADPVLICQGQSAMLTARGARAYLWSDGLGMEDTLIVYPDFPTLYTVTATDAPGCYDIGKVTVNVVPTPWFDLGPDRYELFGNEIILNGPANMDRYHWSTGAEERSILVKEEGIVWLRVETDHHAPEGDISCPASDTLNIGITGCVFVPNAFSPNGNGRNDIFMAKCGFELEFFEMLILNRWGQILFQSQDILQGWDGRYNGELSPFGIYTVIIRFRSPAGQICGKNQIISALHVLR